MLPVKTCACSNPTESTFSVQVVFHLTWLDVTEATLSECMPAAHLHTEQKFVVFKEDC